MNLLYMIIFLLFCILILLIAKYMTGKKIISSLTVFLFSAVVLTTGILLDTLEAEGGAAKAMTRVRYLLQGPAVETSTSTFVEEGKIDLASLPVKKSVLIDAPIINQMPELPRGCEVTSLTMLLQHAGVEADKMVLAEQVKKDPTPYHKENGQVYFGHPNSGFVGDMYTFDNPGLGVYHQPIAELAEQYLPGLIHDFTGSDFEEVKKHLSDGRPVWVIINSHYKQLDPSFFQTWQTPDGQIDITYKEHSVLITGYDNEFVYFNDPLTVIKNRKAPIHEFEDSWVQMGRQAITYLRPYPLADNASEL